MLTDRIILMVQRLRYFSANFLLLKLSVSYFKAELLFASRASILLAVYF